MTPSPREHRRQRSDRPVFDLPVENLSSLGLEDDGTGSDGKRVRPIDPAWRVQAHDHLAIVDVDAVLVKTDITQFLVANMLEWTGYNGSQRHHTFEELISRYNAIVEACETDPSLKIEVT